MAQFRYTILLEVELLGETYALEREWESPTQLSVGDSLRFGRLDDVDVEKVFWDLSEPGRAVIYLEDGKLNDKLTDDLKKWGQWLREDFSACDPHFPGDE